LISSYTFGIYPRSEKLIEATRKNTENLDSLFQKETEEYISAQKNAGLGFVSDPLLKWDDIFRQFVNPPAVKPAALNRIFEMNKRKKRCTCFHLFGPCPLHREVPGLQFE